MSDLPLGELRTARERWAALASKEPVRATDPAHIENSQLVNTIVYAVRDRKLYRHVSKEFYSGGGDCQHVESAILSALRNVVDFPDADLVLHYGDGEAPPRAVPEAGKAPIFIFSSPRNSTHEGTALVGFPNPLYLCSMHRLARWPGGETRRVPWRERHPQAFFRGDMTLAKNVKSSAEVRSAPRFVLGELAKNFSKDLDVTFTDRDPLTELPKKLRQIVQHAYAADRHAEDVDFFEAVPAYKYSLNVDGVTASWRAHPLLASGSVMLLHDSEYGEYFVKDLLPWKHYVPISKNLTDLESTVRYLQEHDDEAAAIAEAGRAFAREGLSPAATECYIAEAFRLAKDTGHPARMAAAELVTKHGFKPVKDRGWRGECTKLHGRFNPFKEPMSVAGIAVRRRRRQSR